MKREIKNTLSTGTTEITSGSDKENQLKKANSSLQNTINNKKPEWTKMDHAIQFILDRAKQFSIDSIEVSGGYETGLSTTVRLGEIETIEFNCDKTLTVTVYQGKKKATVSTNDLNEEALNTVLEKAALIAQYTEEDSAAGLPDKDNLAMYFPDCDLYHPWDLSPEEAIDIAKKCEAEALSLDKRLVNSEGASVTSHQKYRVYGNSLGFLQGYPLTSHSITCGLIAKEKDDMQRDYDFTIARDPNDLENIQVIATRTADKTLKRLKAHKMKTTVAPVLFDHEIAGGLIGHFISAISGGNLYRKFSFLTDALHKKVFPDFITFTEAPHLKRGLASAPFDAEGVATCEHDIVKNGILESYVLSSYSARKLGLQTTGNCGGLHNLILRKNDKDVNYPYLDQAALIKKMHRGLWVTEVMGHGINITTGDYSRGAVGFWVANGEIQYPVHEITIAGNLKEIFLNIVDIGNDIEKRSGIQMGSILVEKMTIAGN